MIITFDTKNNTLNISHTGNHSWGTDVVMSLERYGQTVSLKGVEFGITIKADDVIALDQKWPSKGVRLSKTNQNTLTTTRVKWQPDQQIEVRVWCKTTTGKLLETYDEFTAPRPPQPYPSWTWEDSKWTPPVPYPKDNDEKYYEWDEETKTWIEVKEEKE